MIIEGGKKRKKCEIQAINCDLNGKEVWYNFYILYMVLRHNLGMP